MAWQVAASWGKSYSVVNFNINEMNVAYSFSTGLSQFFVLHQIMFHIVSIKQNFARILHIYFHLLLLYFFKKSLIKKLPLWLFLVMIVVLPFFSLYLGNILLFKNVGYYIIILIKVISWLSVFIHDTFWLICIKYIIDKLHNKYISLKNSNTIRHLIHEV